MSQPVTLSSEEAVDRLAIRELVEAYAYCAAALPTTSPSTATIAD